MYSEILYLVLFGICVIGIGIYYAVTITRRHKIDLERLHHVLNNLLEYHPELIAITDKAGSIIFASNLFKDSIGKKSSWQLTGSFSKFLEKKGSFDYQNILRYLHREKKPLIDYNIRLILGNLERDLDLTIVPVLNSKGRIHNFIHILRPARDKAGLASDLGHLEKLTNIGQIAAGMAHELNTPLGSIILSTGIIKEQLGASSSVAEEVSKIKKQADHCSKVVKQLLGYVRKDEGLKTEQDIKTVIEKVVGLVGTEASKRNIAINVKTTEEGATILCNENQIKQLFFNLVSNAFYAIDKNGLIEIEIAFDALLNQVTILFRDNGSGISKENIDNIFDPFFTTKSAKEGTGIGLALCKKIMLEHNGRITVESIVDKGTTFKLFLPIAK